MRCLLLPAVLAAASLHAQPAPVLPAAVQQPFVLGEVLTFRSTMLDQERALNIYLPAGYADSSAAYPVIYVLDGSTNEDFPHLAGLAQFMHMYGLLPKSIVVGIANNGKSRYRDFTGPTVNDSDKAWVPTHGGSAAFMGFLEREVQPLVQAHYRCAGHRTLIGQSLGGLLATEVLFTRPALFDDYILVSPSLWWNNGALAATAGPWVQAHATLPKRVFIASAPDDAMMQAEIDAVVQAFREAAAPPLKLEHVMFPDESHATILHRAVYRAFEWLYPRNH